MSREKEINENIANIIEGVNGLYEILEDIGDITGSFDFYMDELGDVMANSSVDMSINKTDDGGIMMEVSVSPKKYESPTLEEFLEYINKC